MILNCTSGNDTLIATTTDVLINGLAGGDLIAGVLNSSTSLVDNIPLANSGGTSEVYPAAF